LKIFCSQAFIKWCCTKVYRCCKKCNSFTSCKSPLDFSMLISSYVPTYHLREIPNMFHLNKFVSMCKQLFHPINNETYFVVFFILLQIRIPYVSIMRNWIFTFKHGNYEWNRRSEKNKSFSKIEQQFSKLYWHRISSFNFKPEPQSHYGIFLLLSLPF
jgi:hypothetical protein